MYEFTLKAYTDLIKFLLSKEYTFLRVKDFFDIDGNKEKLILLKHDVDKKPINSLNMAVLENKLGICSTYYFRINKSVYQVELMKQIESLGHEIGYHYEELSTSNGDYNKAINLFERNLKIMRNDFSISTISMHGSPLSKFNNKDIWNVYSMEKYKVLCISKNISLFTDFNYVTDSGRCFNSKNYNVRDFNNISLNKLGVKTIKKFISEENNLPNRILFNFHPQRWTDNYFEWVSELLMQSSKNQLKRFIKKL
ncbi:MAG: hypothetical protein HN691_10525 [Bacteroidetes bacterium]|jgi:hypothetical protein|nr:hypothetical protein [Bacteroidota bacterium]